jgi:hypothetical protein
MPEHRYTPDCDHAAANAHLIAEAARAAENIMRHLDKLLYTLCPGPHLPRQHRDHHPPWCEACGYTTSGRLVGRQSDAHPGS